MIGGVKRKVYFFAMDLPHSDACFVKAYPGETTEAFCDGHVSAFAFFGGVPVSILYDNMQVAVARILGDGRRQRTRVFSELQSHYLFQDRFGRPGKGNEKGKVEGLIGYVRRNFQEDGRFFCIPNKAAADAWCRDNNEGSGWSASAIKADGRHGCNQSTAGQRADAMADCRRQHGDRLIRVFKSNGEWRCEYQTERASAEEDCRREYGNRLIRVYKSGASGGANTGQVAEDGRPSLDGRTGSVALRLVEPFVISLAGADFGCQRTLMQTAELCWCRSIMNIALVGVESRNDICAPQWSR